MTSRLIFFFNDTATTEIYTLSLHDALPIFDFTEHIEPKKWVPKPLVKIYLKHMQARYVRDLRRSEEHTSELQSRQYLVCRLLLEKKKTSPTPPRPHPRLTPLRSITLSTATR